MKKVLLILLTIVTVIATVCFVAWVLLYTGIIGGVKEDNLTVKTYTTEDGHTYTEASWAWKPVESNKIIDFIDTSTVGATTTVPLVFDDETYYNVTIPDVPYIYDYGKTIWAQDGSFMIRVVGNANVQNLSSIAGIDDGINLNQLTLVSQPSKGSRTVVTLVGDVAVVANIFEGNDTLAIIADSLQTNRVTYNVEEVKYSKKCNYLTDISYSGQYAQSITVDEVSLYQERYMFADGFLWTQAVMKPFEQTQDIYMGKISAFSGSWEIDEVYRNDRVVYARSGDYYVGIIKVNANTCLTMLGMGDEANCNIVWNLALQ